jgi:hypothetical protein
VKDKETGQLAPYYLDLLGEGPRLQARACARLHKLSSCLLCGHCALAHLAAAWLVEFKQKTQLLLQCPAGRLHSEMAGPIQWRESGGVVANSGHGGPAEEHQPHPDARHHAPRQPAHAGAAARPPALPSQTHQ